GVGAYVIIGPSVANVFNAIAAPITTSQDFMTALVAKDYAKAYGLVDPSQQAAFGGSADGLQKALSDRGMLPTTFTFTNFSLGTNGSIVNGKGTFNGATKYVYTTLLKSGDNTYKVGQLDVNDNAPTATPPSGS